MENIELTDKMKRTTDERIKRYLARCDKGFTKKDLGRKPKGRYASFDYCFNYFHSFKVEDRKKMADADHMEISCLHLAFFLASWGMLRASSFLLQKSIKFYEPLIKYISGADDSLWKIDAHNYSKEKNIHKLIKCYADIEKSLGKKKDEASSILVTKIMLGVFGNVPAFDTYFIRGSGLGSSSEKSRKKSLERISLYYNDHKSLIDAEAKKRKNFDFLARIGDTSKVIYTRAKIIDMIFFARGQ
jgi:hypothetical protein